MKTLSTIILAAGKGKRMKSPLPKVLHQLGGIALIEHVVKKAIKLKSSNIVAVVPHENESIQEVLSSYSTKNQTIEYAVQDQPLGTAHALHCGLKNFKIKSGHLLVLNGDMPFIELANLKKLIKTHVKNKAVVSLLTAKISKPSGYGRILRNQNGNVVSIIEEKDATKDQKKINEVNVGVYIFDANFVKKNITKIKRKNKQKEYYLTDLVSLAVKSKKTVAAHILNNEFEAMGVNSKMDLQQLNGLFYKKQKQRFENKGVIFVGNEIFIDAEVQLEAGVVIESPCYLKGNSKIQFQTKIEMGCVIKSSEVKSKTLIKAHSYLDECQVGESCQIGPFAHLRPGTQMMAKAKIGNFVETKKSVIGEGSKANHLSYLGDAIIGKQVNVGAGTITCNYNGYKKFKTILEDGVFIGSDTQLVAPVRIGKGAYVGAGTTVTKDVGSNNLVMTRVPQQEINGWAERHRQKNN